MLPWAEMLRAAAQLGLSPQAFWACSLKEWRWLMRPAAAPLERDGLKQLVARYPDRMEECDGSG